MHRKGLVIGILILMLGVNIGSTFAGDVDVKTMSSVGFDGDTLYVGGSGPGNYSKIQDAIDDASDGDTVFVYNGTYNESVVVNKSISLIGENKETAVIQFYAPWCDFSIVRIQQDNVLFCNFTIRCDNSTHPSFKTYGMKINSDNNFICNNIFLNRLDYAMYLTNSFGNKIVNNTIKDVDGYGFYLGNSNNNSFTHNNLNYCLAGGFNLCYSSNNNISKNKIKVADFGIYTYESKSNILTYNTLLECKEGMYVHCHSNSTTISSNMFKRNFIGVTIHGSNLNDICRNNFVLNIIPARFISRSRNDTQNNWSKNYWQRPRIMPKIIPGSFWIVRNNGIVIRIPRFNFDWFPAREPYDI